MAILLMFVASACFVTMAALIKTLGQGLPVTELMFLRSLIALPVLFGLILHGGHPLIVRDWKSASLDRAPTVAAASYASVVLSILYGYLFWDEMPALSSVLGALLIVCGGMYLMVTTLRTQYASSS